MTLGAFINTVRDTLPHGNLLPAEAWQRRHRAILVVLWLHVPLLLGVGVLTGHGLVHSSGESFLVALLAFGAVQGSFAPAVRASFATVGLAASSAILVHFSGGLIEMHFHFFVIVAIVTLYQAWTPFLLAIAFVVLHHATVGIIDPSQVYNHPSAISDPIKWALVHALFIAAESAAGLTAWKMNELVLRREIGAREELQVANHDLAEAQSMASIGSWDWDVVTGNVWWSEEMYRILGLSSATFGSSFEGFMSAVHLDDIARVRTIVEEASTSGKRLRLRGPSDPTRWFGMRRRGSRPVDNGSGRKRDEDGRDRPRHH